MRAPSTWHTSKRTSFTMMSPTKLWKQRRECRKAKPQASRLRFALVWIPAPAEILSGRLDPAERHLRMVGEGEFQPRPLERRTRHSAQHNRIVGVGGQKRSWTNRSSNGSRNVAARMRQTWNQATTDRIECHGKDDGDSLALKP